MDATEGLREAGSEAGVIGPVAPAEGFLALGLPCFVEVDLGLFEDCDRGLGLLCALLDLGLGFLSFGAAIDPSSIPSS